MIAFRSHSRRGGASVASNYSSNLKLTDEAHVVARGVGADQGRRGVSERLSSISGTVAWLSSTESRR